MSLARGEQASALLIAIAPSEDERMRVARLVGDHVAVLLVSSVEDAVSLLDRERADRLARRQVVAVDEETALTVDSDQRTANYDGASVALSPLEHDLLCCLLADAGHTLRFEELHEQIWGTGHLGGLADVQSVVKRLRRKLRDLRCPVRITSVRGVGLRLDGRLSPSASTA